MRAAWIGMSALALMSCAPVEQAGAPVAATAPTSQQDEARLRQLSAAVLFWSPEERMRNFPAMETIFPGNEVRNTSPVVRMLPDGAPLALPKEEIDAFMAAQNVAGLIVVKDGKVLLERYGLGWSREGRWTSFSVAKSVTSTLVGAAIKDGDIKSLDDPVTRYIPDLAGGGYDGVTIRQILTMTSGVRWNEDYTDPNSDVARMFAEAVPAGMDPTVAYMRKLPRIDPPGAKFVYKTGETNLIGVLVRRATGKRLADYLSEKIWTPYAMQRPAFWMTDQSGAEVSGCCLSVSLRDYALLGMMTLEDDGRIVPKGWFADATRTHVTFPGGGYGYQWWTFPGGYAAQGIFGQSILVEPKSKLVIAIASNWPKATDRELSQARLAFAMKVLAAANR